MEDEDCVDVQCESCHEWFSTEPAAFEVEVEFNCPLCGTLNVTVFHED